MALSQFLQLLLVITVTYSSAFTLLSIHQRKQRRCSDKISQLFMGRSFKPTDPYAVKVRSKKVSKYNMPGYSKGDLDNLKIVFKLFLHTEAQIPSMSFDSFLSSKYLRYWPGSEESAGAIWKEVTEGSSDITMKQLSSLLSKLDKSADQNELECEKERLAWELEDLNHDLLETFFEKNAVKNKLSFSDFINWENVQEEIWYNEKGLNVKGVADIWEKLTGCTSKDATKEIFVKIYSAVCDVSYTL